MIQTKWCTQAAELQDAYRVRDEVFIAEQGFSRETEYDEIDKTADHAVVYDGATPVAAGRLYETDGGVWGIGRICVLREHRGQHYGDLLVRVLLNRGLNKGARLFRINAQLHAKSFYEKFGFVAVGEAFWDECVDAIMMEVAAQDVKFPRACDGM